MRAYDAQDEDNFTQAGKLFNIMGEEQKQQLTSTIADGLVQASSDVQQRMLAQFGNADSGYRERVENELQKRL